MTAHRTLRDLKRAFSAPAPGRLADPGDEGTITVLLWGQICSVTTEAAETRTLAQPTCPGIECAVVLDTDGGNLTLTVTGGYNRDADTDITFADAGDYVKFYSVKVGTSYLWRAYAQEGTDAAVEEGTFDTVTATTATLGTVTASVGMTTVQHAITGDLFIQSATVAAAGSQQSDAGQLASGFSLVSAADDTKGVKLPAAVAGLVCIVKNNVGDKTLELYPATGDAINAIAANSAITLAAVTSCLLVAYDATTWYTVPLLPS